ncbi:MAG TPA: HAD family phosphatase [Acidimicrobiia bacterium]|nr:HAD family phosphatase [Acidimicrobiia bacterium]
MRRPAAVVFDCDGVLVDSEPHSITAWVDVLGRLGHPAGEAEIAACTGLGFSPTHDALSGIALLPPKDEVWPLLLEALGRSFGTGLRIFPDGIGALRACEGAGVPIAVASASPRERLDLTLRAGGLDGRFGVSISGDDVARGKPAPDCYLAAAEGLGVDPAECVAVEDSAPGATAAVAAGMRTIAVAREMSDREALVESGAQVVDLLLVEHLGV